MNWSRLKYFVFPHRNKLIFCLALMLLETLSTLTVPWIGGHIANGILDKKYIDINYMITGLVLLLFTQASLRIINSIVLTRISADLNFALKQQTHRHLLKLPMSFWHHRQRGDLMALLTNEVGHLTSFVTGPLLRALPILLALCGAIFMMFTIEPILAIPVILGVPCFFIAMKLIGRRLRSLATHMRQTHAQSLAIADEQMAIVPAIKAFTRETFETQRYEQKIDEFRISTTKLGQIQAAIGPSITFLSTTAIIVVLWLASDKIDQGDLSAGELISFLLYAGMLTRPVSSVAESWSQYQLAKSTLKRMDDIFDMPGEGQSGISLPQNIPGALTFKNLSFAYPDRPKILKSINLTIEPGQIIALTGDNGAGKSTIANLILRFYEPDEGQIKLDGIDISSVNIESLRRTIANVPQEPLLINGTIAENILLGKPDATEEMIISAASSAQAWSFINDLPDGLQTIVGEHGIRLSGGQRQRLALARALIKDPKILIFDEPTAMFDPRGEEDFVNSVRSALIDRTVILITHRPASLALADRVIKLEHGQIYDI